MFLLAGASLLRAQERTLTLTGNIDMATGEKFPYSVVFSEHNGAIRGYSVTYHEPNETKTAINGILDKHKHTLSFRESVIISSHGFHTKAFMCLVDAHLEYMQSGTGNILTGPANSKEADRTSCTAGTITFSDVRELRELFARQEQFDTVISMKKKTNEMRPAEAVKESVPAPATDLVTDKITEGIDRAYAWHSDTAVVDVWDGGDIDGDRVTITFNGKPVLTNYFLLKEKRRLKLPLHSGMNTIAIFADNEGSDPPNTASLLLTDGQAQYSVLAYNPKGKTAVIRIKKVK